MFKVSYKNFFYIADVFLPSRSAYSIHVMKMCNSFAKKKFRVSLFCLNKKNSNLFNYYNCKNKFKIIGLKQNKNNFFTRIIFGFKVLKKIHATNDELILSRSIFYGLLLSLFEKKVILEIHHDLKGFTKFLVFLFHKTKYFKSINIIFISKKLSNSKIYNKNNFIILDDAVELSDFKKIRSNKKINYTCVYTGSLTKGKGIENILNIAKITQNINFHIYGDIKNSNYSEIDFKNNVKFCGYIKHKDIPKILNKYEVLLMPYSDKVYVRSSNLETGKYMSPLKLFEYMAAKKIIIARDLKVYSHILNNKNSILISSSNAQNWSTKIKFIFKNKKKFVSLGLQAYNDVKKYTWDKRVSKIINFAKV